MGDKVGDKDFTLALTGDIDTFEGEDENCLNCYFDVVESHNITCTIPVTAEAVQNYPARAKLILERGHELAGHGDVHEEFLGPVELQVERLQRMIDMIEDCTGYTVEGFRSPFIDADENLFEALEIVGLKYDSTFKIFGFICKRLPYFKRHYLESKGYKIAKPFLKLAGRMYNSLKKTNHAPHRRGGIVEIPVIGDSDFSLIESEDGPKFPQGEAVKVGVIWWEHVDILRRSNNAVALQAHPGRVSPGYLEGLDYFCKKCRDNGIKFATLKEISRNLS